MEDVDADLLVAAERNDYYNKLFTFYFISKNRK